MFNKILKFCLIIIALFIIAGCQQPGDNGGNNNGDNNDNQNTAENYEYTTPETDKLKLTESYEGKDFIQDGIGEVTVTQFVDGDTTIFRGKTGSSFTVRYLGIDTPESTYRIDPWGFASSNHTKAQLKSAHKIVLQAEGKRVDNNDRYLAWVWLISEDGDSRLLNLELAELAYCYAKSGDTSLDAQFMSAIYNVQKARCRIYGQTDPSYDYSTESLQISLKDLRQTYGTKEATLAKKDVGKKIVVSGVVARMVGRNSCFIQQYDEESGLYYGVYAYGGYNTQAAFAVGNSVVIEAKIGYYSGSLQLTEVKATVHSWAPEDNPEQEVNTLEIQDASIITTENTDLFGRLVKIDDLTVTGGRDTDTSDAFTIKCSYQTASGTTQTIDIRVDANVLLKDGAGNRITTYEYFVGMKFASLTAVVSYYDYNTEDDKYNGYIQLMLTSMDDIVLAE